MAHFLQPNIQTQPTLLNQVHYFVFTGTFKGQGPILAQPVAEDPQLHSAEFHSSTLPPKSKGMSHHGLHTKHQPEDLMHRPNHRKETPVFHPQMMSAFPDPAPTKVEDTWNAFQKDKSRPFNFSLLRLPASKGDIMSTFTGQALTKATAQLSSTIAQGHSGTR
ncbi:hypothetical protein Ancab_021748, partial [Ancistrocladus abbreviatus]